jgi:hypothetical protein
MDPWQIVWDLEDDPEGNVQHILEHDVTMDEVEEILLDPQNDTIISRESGNPITFGWTSTGKYLAVPWENVCDDPKMVYPLTAYPATPPRGKKHGKGRHR